MKQGTESGPIVVPGTLLEEAKSSHRRYSIEISIEISE